MPERFSEDFSETPTIENFEIVSPPLEDSFTSIEGSPEENWSEDSSVPQYTADPIEFSDPGLPVNYELLEQEELRENSEGEDFGERYIQVGAFVKLESLYNLIDRLSSEYNVQAFTSTVNGQEYNRCIIGPFGSVAAAQQALERLKTQGNLRDAFMIRQPIAQWIGN